MSPGRPVQVVELGRAGQAHLEHLRLHGAYEVSTDGPPGIAWRVHLHSGLYLDIFQPSLAEELRDTSADPWIGAVAAEGHREDVAEPVEGRVRRVAPAVLGVGFHGCYPAARPGQPHHLGSHVAGVGEVDQQRAGVYQVKGTRWQSGPPGVRGHDLHTAQPPPGGKLGGQGGMRRVRVKADDPACRCDPLGQHVQNAARTAAEIDDALSRPQANPVQKRCAIGCQLVRLTKQPGALAGTAAQRIDDVGILIRSCPEPTRPIRPCRTPSQPGLPSTRYSGSPVLLPGRLTPDRARADLRSDRSRPKGRIPSERKYTVPPVAYLV